MSTILDFIRTSVAPPPETAVSDAELPQLAAAVRAALDADQGG